ncbi:hypothetical protein [Mucilaginibacter sp. UR6-11]|uniref:hypothetical protein n=1 Tax=Mucilaginibacter sp. UR6-11 TaxID=1435644 RepID=UPI001E439F1D|nr:hypothetical protein [Mucilaginibacter sp. UR6-11]MCC8427301.1 hypothetical protein [Mucilaginibacter sp. UR6-11]
MNKIILLLTIVIHTTFCYAQDVLTNKSVIGLTKAGLSSSIIINKIKTSKCSFDLSTDALIVLKETKVSDEVINTMLDKQPASINVSNTAADKITNKFAQSGIYYYAGESDVYTRVDPTLVTGNKMGSNILTGTMKSKSTLDGGESNLQVSKTPVFYFYFEHNTESKLNNTSATNNTSTDEFMALMQSYAPTSKSNQAFSPNDFKLIKLDKNRNSRTFETGKISLLGGVSNGVSKNVTGFKYTEISSNLYKVYFPTGLPAGEYCFMYATSAASGGVGASMTGQVIQNDTKVYDFGIK